METGLWREHRGQEVTFLLYETSAKLLKLTFQGVGEKKLETEVDMAEEVEQVKQVEQVEEEEVEQVEAVEEEEEVEGDKSER